MEQEQGEAAEVVGAVEVVAAPPLIYRFKLAPMASPRTLARYKSQSRDDISFSRVSNQNAVNLADSEQNSGRRAEWALLLEGHKLLCPRC